MTDNKPDAGVGRDIRVEIGRFECTCGYTILEPSPLDDYIELVMGSPDFPFTQGTITCSECNTEWALVDDGVHWEKREP